MDKRSKRAAAEKSIDYLQMYAEKILAEGTTNYYKRLDSSKPGAEFEIHSDKYFKQYYDEHGFNYLTPGPGSTEFADGFWRIRADVGSVLNNLELYSMTMIHGIADEEIAFLPTSNSFCNFVKYNYLALCIARENNTPYDNIIRLFELWQDRIIYLAHKDEKRKHEHAAKLSAELAAGLEKKVKGIKPM